MPSRVTERLKKEKSERICSDGRYKQLGLQAASTVLHRTNYLMLLRGAIKKLSEAKLALEKAIMPIRESSSKAMLVNIYALP